MRDLKMSRFDIANTKMYARDLYSRDWLAVHLARTDNTTVLFQMRKLARMHRDDLIDMLSVAIQIGAATNSIRAAYVRERLSRFKYRRSLRRMHAKECPVTLEGARAA